MRVVTYEDYEVPSRRDTLVRVSRQACPACGCRYSLLEGEAYPRWGYEPYGSHQWVCKSCVDALASCESCGAEAVVGEPLTALVPCSECFITGACRECLVGEDGFVCKLCDKLRKGDRAKRGVDGALEGLEKAQRELQTLKVKRTRREGTLKSVKKSKRSEKGQKMDGEEEKGKSSSKRVREEQEFDEDEYMLDLSDLSDLSETLKQFSPSGLSVENVGEPTRTWLFPHWARIGGVNPFEDKGQAEIFQPLKRCFHCKSDTPFPANTCWECGGRIGRVVHRK